MPVYSHVPRSIRFPINLHVATPSPNKGKTERGILLSPFFLCHGEGVATHRLISNLSMTAKKQIQDASEMVLDWMDM